MKNNFRVGERVLSTYPGNLWSGIHTIVDINDYEVTLSSYLGEGLIGFKYIKKLSWKQLYERKKSKKVYIRE